MVAINKGFAPLVYRYGGFKRVPTEVENVWDTVPFNTPTFCELNGIRCVPGEKIVGFNEVPDQLETAQEYWTPKLREEYARRLPGAVRLLRYLDKQYISDFVNKNINVEQFQNTYRGAPGKADWEWIWGTVFDQPGGLKKHLVSCMLDLGCDAATAYRKHRKDVKEVMCMKNKVFLEHKTAKSVGFDRVWSGAREKLTLAIFGQSIFDSDGDRDDWFDFMTRALCFRIFETERKRVNRSVEELETTEKGLVAAYNDALKHPTIANLRMVVNYHVAIVNINRATGINVMSDTGGWSDRIKSLYKELGAEIVDGK
ncbi:hypothetical protein V565_204360, partial [Rhizoctonia solani 123E]